MTADRIGRALMRIAHVLADVFPALTAKASELHYRWLQR